MGKAHAYLLALSLSLISIEFNKRDTCYFEGILHSSCRSVDPFICRHWKSWSSVHFSNIVHVDLPLMIRYTRVSNWQGFSWRRLSNTNTPVTSPSVTMLSGVCSWCLEYSWLIQESPSLVWILFGVWILPRSGVLSLNGFILILHLSLLLWGMSRLF